jgi:Protein of unknown function (DUF2868)
MTLANLVDLEAQLARDRDGDPAALAARDRALLSGVAVDPRRRGELLAAWLEALRAREPNALFPGALVSGALSGLRAVLVLGGVLLGWGAATAVLTGGGAHPVNVWDFLLAFVFVQLALLALLAASFLLPLAAMGAPVLGLFRGAVGAIYPRVAARGLAAGGERAHEWRALWHRARTRRSLYHAVEPWLLLAVTQAFAVAFNAGALAAILRLVVFSDVSFGWSTTLTGLDARRFHALVEALAAPWRALWPAAVPAQWLVEATRYSHLEGAYLLSGAGRSAQPDVVGGWWPFLVAALVAYGLLPRAVLLAAARVKVARLLSRLPHDDAEVSRVVERLCAPHLETRAAVPEGPAGEPPRALAGAAGAARGSSAAVVLWRDVPGGPALESALARGLGLAVARTRAAGGKDAGEGSDGWAEVSGGGEQVVVVAEAFEPPDRGVRRLLSELRRALGPRRLLLVVLVGAAGERPGPPRDVDVRIWRDALAALADPFLSVEPLREAP